MLSVKRGEEKKGVLVAADRGGKNFSPGGRATGARSQTEEETFTCMPMPRGRRGKKCWLLPEEKPRGWLRTTPHGEGEKKRREEHCVGIPQQAEERPSLCKASSTSSRWRKKRKFPWRGRENQGEKKKKRPDGERDGRRCLGMRKEKREKKRERETTTTMILRKGAGGGREENSSIHLQRERE